MGLCIDRTQRRGGSSSKDISVPNLLRMTGRVLVCFLAFDVVGVVLTLLVELVAALDIVWESSTLLGYVVWFVVGVFCALFIYVRSDDDYDSPEVRRRGLKLLVIASVLAVALGALSSLVWSENGADELVAPDHRGITITYLTTVVLVIALLRFVLFRGHVRAKPRSAEPPDEYERYQRALERFAAKPEPDREDPDPDDSGVFRPAGFWATVGFLVGVPVLLFLDASFFLLGPFDFFDRWTDPILTTSLAGGLAWGFASARWQSPRVWLLVAHAPLLIGTISYFPALLVGGLLVGLGVPGRVSEIVSYGGFGIGFLLGCAAVVGKFAEFFDRVSHRVVRP